MIGSLLFLSTVLSLGNTANPSCSRPADILFLLDDSSSIPATDFTRMLDFVKGLVGQFDISTTTTRVAAATFSQFSEEEFPFGKYNTRAEVQNAVGSIRHSIGLATYTYDGINFARNTMFTAARNGVPHILVIITDGVSTNRAKTKQAAEEAIKAGITIIVIGVGKMDRVQLEEMASSPVSSHLFTVDDFPSLSSIGALVTQQTCQVTAPPTTDLPKDQAQKECSHKPAEVVFVLDKSSSIYIENFKKQLDFVNTLIDIFDVGVGKTRVAAVSFSTNASIEYHLDEYHNKADLKARTSKIIYTGGNTETRLALTMVRDQVFVPAHGFRPNVAHIVIVITDGKSQYYMETKAVAKTLKDAGIHMFAIGVGQNVDPIELRDIGSLPTSQYVFEVNGFDSLSTIKNILAYRTCEQTP